MRQAAGSSWTADISARLARSGPIASRRRVGTVAAIGLAATIGYHVVAGNNGWNVYQQKRAEDKALAAELKTLEEENARLRRHVEHLANDPDAIEFEAHRTLRYMKPGQVTVLNDGEQTR